MFRKIQMFLYAVTHAHGRLFALTAELGPFHGQLWVGRENPAAVGFSIDVEFTYYAGFPALDASVKAGVIEVQLYLTKNSSE